MEAPPQMYAALPRKSPDGTGLTAKRNIHLLACSAFLLASNYSILPLLLQIPSLMSEHSLTFPSLAQDHEFSMSSYRTGTPEAPSHRAQTTSDCGLLGCATAVATISTWMCGFPLHCIHPVLLTCPKASQASYVLLPTHSLR